MCKGSYNFFKFTGRTLFRLYISSVSKRNLNQAQGPWNGTVLMLVRPWDSDPTENPRAWAKVIITRLSVKLSDNYLKILKVVKMSEN